MSNLVEYKEYNLEANKASSIEQSFLPKIEEKNGYQEVYKKIIRQEINQETVIEAGELRKKLKKVRTGIAKIHKNEKAYFFQAGKFVDAIKNKLTEPVVQMEEKLSDIENFFENQEKERLAKIQKEREQKLSQYVNDTSHLDLSSMDAEVWQAFFDAKKQQYIDKQKAIEEANKRRLEIQRLDRLEQKRKLKLAPYKQFLEGQKLNLREISKEEFENILASCKDAEKAHQKEQEKIRKENDRLKKEREAAREKQIRLEQKRKEQEAKRKKEYESKLKKEREQRIALERAELKRKKKIEQEKKRLEKLAKAPIKKQITEWLNRFHVPENKPSHEVVNTIEYQFKKFQIEAKKQIDKI